MIKQTPQSLLSDITVHMKSAKYLPEKNRRENWQEIVNRNKSMHILKYPDLKKEIEKAYEFVYGKKVLPSMRSMQFAGKSINVNPARIFNCSYLPLDHWLGFSEIMFLLLGGTGVGFSVQHHHVDQLPEIRRPSKKKRRFLVGDSIEGWADAIKVLMKSYFFGKSTVDFDFSDIRPKGSLLVTAGGKAPGPQPLIECVTKIRGILEDKQDGDKLSTLEVHDIICHIADAVLAGGIRRAALISLFSADDQEMISCKSGNWWELNPQRGRANNSAVLLRHKLTEEFFLDLWKKIELSGSGEPGIYQTNDKDWGTNPCCFAGGTKILTENGYRSISSLVDEVNLKLTNVEGENVSGLVWSNGVKEVVRVDIAHPLFSYSIYCTPDHVFMTEDGREIEAKDMAGKYILSYENKYPVLISSVTPAGEMEVFDFSLEDDTHWGVVEDLIAHNCEIALRPYQFCNLTEINASDIESQEDFNERARVASFIGTLQSGYTDFHYLRSIWKKNTEKDALIGVSMTGIASMKVFEYSIEEAVEVVKKENERVAELIGINKAARTTCVKPAGTTSLTLGTSSGIHAWHNDYYIRRIRVAKNESIYSYLKENNPELLEDDIFRPHDTAVISIPQKAPEGSVIRTESTFDLLERVREISERWVKQGHREGQNQHNVSATISIMPDEWQAVGNWMWKNRNSYNGLSVLPYDGGTYQQAPFEDITEEQYYLLLQSLRNIDLNNVVESEDNTDLSGELACAGGSCEIN